MLRRLGTESAPRKPAPRRPAPKPATRHSAGALAVALGGCALGGCAPAAANPDQAAANPDQAAARADWVEETLAALTPRERVAQLVMVWMSGGYASADDEELSRVEALAAEDGIGGIVISLGTPLGYAWRLDRLQSRARVPLLVTADFETGAGFRVSGVYALPNMLAMAGATVLPPAMALGAADDEELAHIAGRITGTEARALGVHLTFAPVLDVNNNPANPIINTRSFGEDPARVAALGAAFIQGARETGLLTTAKHFPGHGDTGTDSHVALPVIPGDRTRLDSLELVPFRRAIEEGVDAVMTAHVAAPAILGPGAPPATLSPYFMTEMLRDDLGFDGVLFTDALDMGAIADGYGTGEAAIRALEAGADVLLMPREPLRAIAAVEGAMRTGRLTPERIDASVRRLLTLKARAGLAAPDDAALDDSPLRTTVGTEDNRRAAETIAARSITLARDQRAVIPFDPRDTRSVLSVTFAATRDLAAGRAFDARLRGSVRVRSARVGFDTHPDVYESLARVARSVDAVTVSAYVRPGAAGRDGDLPSEIPAFLDALDAAGANTVLVSFGSPYLLTSVPHASAYLLAWGGGESSQTAAADALLGAPITGRLPISLPPWHAIGDGLDRGAPALARAHPRHPWEDIPENAGMDPAALARADELIETAIRDGATPGAALVVGRGDRVVRLRGYGRLDWSETDAETFPRERLAGVQEEVRAREFAARGAAAPAREALATVTDSSLYDLASLTKVIATTTAVMQLVDWGDLTLDTPIGAHLPEWSEGWKRDVTVRHLLTHRGGLPPFRPFWRTLRGEEEYRAAFAALDPDYAPGTETVYSDIGLMTLAFLVEEITGRAFDAGLYETVFRPLGMRDTWFNPPNSLRRRVAPTEIDTVYRHRHVLGEVHDENAHAIGGVAGHAGLFSTARDLAAFSAWVLAAAREGRGLAPADRPGPARGALTLSRRLRAPAPATVAQFVARADTASSRALGWDTPSGRSSAGDYFGERAFGHTGFTGTSMWMDPELDLYVVLLTNRVNPTRENQKHVALRRAVHDAVATAIRDQPVSRRAEGAPQQQPGESARGPGENAGGPGESVPDPGGETQPQPNPEPTP